MRLETLLLSGAGGDYRLHFHERLTVLAGLNRDARQYLIEELVGTLAGLATDARELAFVDRSGKRTMVRRGADNTTATQHPDGSRAPHPAELLGLDAFGLFGATYVRGSDIGVSSRPPSEHPQLREARAALAAFTDELGAAQLAAETARALRAELEDLERQIRDIEHGREKRRFARMVVKLEQARSELAAGRATADELAADRAAVVLAHQVRPLAEQWRAAARAVKDAKQKFGYHPRLDPETLAGALTLPELAPPNLDDLTTAFEIARGERDALANKLASLLATKLPPPSDPEVVRLARYDQETVWSTARRAADTGHRVEREALALGGLVPDGVKVRAVEELDEAHAKVEQAKETIEERRFGALAAAGGAALAAVAIPVAPIVAPLALAGAASAAYWAVLAPRRELAEAEGWEEEALTKAGVPTYLAFHLRRQHALADPHLRRPLEEAAEEHRIAIADWRALGGDVEPAYALSLELEVRNYAAQLQRLSDGGDELEELRRRLEEEAEPAVERARAALLEACRPYGITDTTLAADLVRQLAGVATLARAQHGLEQAEAAERPLREGLESALGAAGDRGGDIEGRLHTLEARATEGETRLRHRAQARAPETLAPEIAELEALVEQNYRPEFGALRLPEDAQEPDPESLRGRHAATRSAYLTAARLVPDVNRLADRRSAMERRVAALAAELGEARTVVVDLDQVEGHLRRRLAGAASAGPNGERVPLLLDEPFPAVRADQKWDLLDLVNRLSVDGQIVLLTADPDVPKWARARASSGGVMLLEPRPDVLPI